MIKNANFSVRQLRHALDEIGVSYSVVNPLELDGLAFTSLFAPRHKGIYFLEGGLLSAAGMDDSVFITSRAIEARNACQFIVDDPQVTYYRVMQRFFAETDVPVGIHPSAIVSAQAEISPQAWIGPFCVIGAARIESGVCLVSHVVVHDNCVIEADVRIESHSTIGATGVAWAWDVHTGERVVQPQIGGAQIGRGCFIGTDVTVVRGSINEVTRLGDNCMVAHGTKIGHGSIVGRNVHFANNVSLAGNVHVADRAFLGSACVLRPKVRIAEDVVVGAGAVVTSDIDEPYAVVAGVPAKKIASKERHAGVPKKFSIQGDK